MKLGGQRRPTRKGEDRIERGRQLREHRLGREPGRDGRENGCERLINVVMIDKPKVLIGLNQNGKWAGQIFFMISDTGRNPTGRESESKASAVRCVERGNPMPLPQRQANRKAC